MLKQISLKNCHFLGFLFLFIVLAFSLNAQTLKSGIIKGSIVDEEGKSLPFASVFLKLAADSSTYRTAMSNDDGLFSFNAVKEGGYLLELRMMGYLPVIKGNITVNALNPGLDLGQLQLRPAAKMLNAVTINSKVPYIERQADKIVVNLNNGINAGASLMEVMDRLPGVQVTPNDIITLNGRGVQIYIDGKLTPLSAEALAGLLKGMASENIQKIELIAHPSSKYEAAGSGGVINIVKKRNHKEGASGNVYGGVGKGEYGKHNGGLNLNFKNENYNLLLNTNYSFNKYYVDSKLVSDFYNPDQTLTAQSIAQINSIRSNRSFAPSLGLDLYLSKKTTLSIAATESITAFHRDAVSLTDDFNAEKLKTGNSDFLTLLKTKTNNFSSGLHLLHQVDTLGKEYTVDVDYFKYGNHTDQNNTNSLYGANGSFINTTQSSLDQDRNFNAYSAKADYTLPLKEKAKLELGLKSSYVVSDNSNQLFDQSEVLDLSALDQFRYTENINALYGTYSKSYQKLSYQFGLRTETTFGKGTQLQTAEKVDQRYIKLFPSAFFDYKFNNRHSLNMTFNKRIERPTYENLNPLIRIINANNYVQGNPELQPVIAYNASVSYSYQNAFSIAMYYSVNLHDFTTVASTFGEDNVVTTMPVNNKKTQYYSFYLTYNKQVNSWWYTGTQASLQQQPFQSVVNGIPYNQPGLLSFNFNTYDSFQVWKKFFIDALYTYRGKSQERTVTNAANSYLTAGLRKVFKKGSLSFNVTDIFNSFTNRYVQNSVLIKQSWNNNYETRIYRLNFSYNFGGNIKKTKMSTAADNEKSRTSTKEN